MRNIIQLKAAKSVEPGEHILTPQHPTGILLAMKVSAVEPVDGGKRMEIQTGEGAGRRLHVVSAQDTVVVVI